MLYIINNSQNRLPLTARLLLPFGQKLFRYRIVRALFVPAGGGYPPARAVPKKLDAVDAAAFFFAVVVGKFVGRKDVSDVAEPAHDAIDLALGKPFAGKIVIHRVDVLLMTHYPRADLT